MDHDDEYPLLLASSSCPSKPFFPDDGIMELFWQNGHVVIQNQNFRPLRKPQPPNHSGDVIPYGPPSATDIDIRPSHQAENYNNLHQHLFMQEDEMVSWLHDPILDDSPLDHNFCTDLLYSPQTLVNNGSQITHSTTMQTDVRTSQVTELWHPSTSVPPRPPIRPTWRTDTKLHEPVQFSKHNTRVESGPSSSRTAVRGTTVVDSCDTLAAAATSVVSEAGRSSADPTEGNACRVSMSTAGVAAPSTTANGGTETMTAEMTATSSPGGSSGSAKPPDGSLTEDRKRKGREADDSECHIEEVDYDELEGAKKQVRGSKSTKRSRAAEVHNLSERRRRDRINEKMRALQELIPRCNKSDKASMLDDAIEYLKTLQLQVQMMSMHMGCEMVPMMYMGTEMGMMAFPNAGPIRPHQMPFPFFQNPTMIRQNTSEPSTSRGHQNPENHQSENR